MGIHHNLSTITDNLSGFDPVAGEVDGTTIGKDYVMWQVVVGLLAANTNLALITAGAPTPTFLRGVAGSITSAPAKSANTAAATIRIYDTTDPGLVAATPSATVIEFVRTGSTGGVRSVFWNRLKYMVSGGSLYAPAVQINYESTTDYTSGYQSYCWASASATQTVMANIPKVIFWWNDQGSCLLMAINKPDGAGVGGFWWHIGAASGYKHNVGAIINDGVDIGLSFGFTGTGTGFTEGITQAAQGQYNGIATNLSCICSAGELPTNLFTFDGINNMIGGNLWLAAKSDTGFKAITDAAIEGILLGNTTAANYAQGVIHQFNTKWYLALSAISDGRDTYRTLFELGT